MTTSTRAPRRATAHEAAPRRSWLRRHWLMVLAVLVAAALRVVVMVAYQPALLFPDAVRYLIQAHHFYLSSVRPSFYPLLLVPVVRVTDSLVPIAAAQHLLGLALSVVAYRFLLRRGLPPWGATLGVLPLLLDPLQIALEQFVLSDVFFEVLLVGACLTVLWKHRPSLGRLAMAGLLVGLAGITRGAGAFLIVIFVVALLCLRVSWVKLVAFVMAAVIPMGIYATCYYATTGEFALVNAGPRFLYSRIAPIAHCHGDPLPAYQRQLCPPGPVSQRHDANWYMWYRRHWVQYKIKPSHGMTQLQIIKDFDKRVIRAEPLVYTKAVLKDAAVGFAPSRTAEVPGYPASYWLMDDHYFPLDTFPARGARWKAEYHYSYDPSAASFMKTYRQLLWTPGPLMALLLVVAAVAAAGFGRARRSGDRVAIGLLAGSCAIVLLTGAAFSGFSWRYQLTQIPLIPMAGALAVAVLLRGRATGTPEPAPPLRVLDRVADRISRRAADRGRLQLVVAAVLGAMAGVVFAAAALASGFAAVQTAALLGAAFGVFVVVLLVVARARSAEAPGGRGG